jgi:hypothetical protein
MRWFESLARFKLLNISLQFLPVNTCQKRAQLNLTCGSEACVSTTIELNTN